MFEEDTIFKKRILRLNNAELELRSVQKNRHTSQVCIFLKKGNATSAIIFLVISDTLGGFCSLCEH